MGLFLYLSIINAMLFLHLKSRFPFLFSFHPRASWPGGGGAGGHGPSSFFDIVGVFETLMVSWKTFGLLLLVKVKVLNFIGKSLNLAPYITGATTPLLSSRFSTKAVSKCCFGNGRFPRFENTDRSLFSLIMPLKEKIDSWWNPLVNCIFRTTPGL